MFFSLFFLVKLLLYKKKRSNHLTDTPHDGANSTDIGIKADGAVFIDHTRGGIVMSFMGSKSWQSFMTE